jgi:SnoaL-like protein
MTREGFTSLLQTLGQAWTDRDYDKAIGFFANDVHYGDPLRYSLNSRADLLRFFQADGGYEQRTDWHTVLFDQDRQIGAAEYSYQGTHLYHGVVLIKVENDKIARWREYQHISDEPWEEFTADTAFETSP